MSITARLDRKVKAAIATIDENAWTTIEYTDAVYDESTGQWISRAEVAEIAFTAFSSKTSQPTTCQADWWCAASPTSTPHQRHRPSHPV